MLGKRAMRDAQTSRHVVHQRGLEDWEESLDPKRLAPVARKSLEVAVVRTKPPDRGTGRLLVNEPGHCVAVPD